MKAVALSLLLASAAFGQVSPNTEEALRESLATRDALVLSEERNKLLQSQLATARQENIDQIAAVAAERKEFKATIRAKDKIINSPWVRAILFVRNTFYWIAGISGLLYALALVGGFFRPHTFVFGLAQWLIRVLPFGNFVDNFHATTVVKTVTTPIVDPPAVVTKAPADSDAAQRLAAMTAGATVVTPPVAATAPLDLSQSMDGTFVQPVR